MKVRATRTIDAPPEKVFAFLEEPDRHWQLLGDRLEPLRAYDGQRSQARLHGPLFIRRTLWIEMGSLRPPSELIGRVEAGHGQTIGTVQWLIDPLGDAPSPEASRDGAAPNTRRDESAYPAATRSTVTLTARTDVSGLLDWLLLTFGGARWLRESLELVLAQLERRLAGEPSARLPS